MQWNKVLSGSASVLALTLATGGAYAQTDQQPVETVVVTGMRASMASAIDVKKHADQFVDSIVSEDIGKLPDNQVVDALQHVTGLQVQHGNGNGENNQIWIRGLPDIATTLNGREMFTTTGRFVSLADIPADLLARVDIKKTTEANDLEGGLAGLIDVRLHRPFDFDGLEIAGSAHAAYGTVAKHVDPDASFLISDRWNSKIGEIGMLLDVSYKKQHYQDEDAFDYYSGATVSNASGSAHSPETLGGIQYPGKRERASLNFSTQWRPNSDTEVYAEVFYTRYRNPNSVNFLIGLPGNNNPVSDFTTVTDPNGLLEMKTSSSCCFELTSGQSFRDSSNTYQFASGVTWTGENLTLSSELDYTDSAYKRTGVIVDTAIFEETDFDTNNSNSGTPSFSSTDPAGWLVAANYHPTQLFDQWTQQSGNEIDWRGDASYSFGDGVLKSIDAGLRYTNRYGKNRADWGGAISCYGGTDQMGADPAVVNSAACNGGAWWGNNVEAIFPGMMTPNAGAFFKGERTWGLGNWLNANADWTQNNIETLRAAFGQSTTAPAAIQSNSFDDREQGYAAYLKVNYDLMLDDMPLTGNLGVRVVDTKSDMKAFVTSVDPMGNITYAPIDTGKESADWMPSLNAKLTIQDDLLLRFGVGRTVTRPTFAQLNPGLYLSAGSNTFENNGTAGNPNLAPVKSNNADLGLEYYYGKGGLLNATVFYRQIDGYVQYLSAAEVHGGISYQVTRPQNGGGGHLQGLEAGYTQWFDMLPGFLSGFGIQANGTFIEGKFVNLPSTDKVPYGGVSKYSFNLVPMYESGPVSVRLSYNWRSSYISGTTLQDGTSVNPSSAYTRPYGELGLSASYNWNEHLVLTFDANNIMDSIYQDHFGQGAYAVVYPRDTRHYDQIFTIGARYRM